MTPTLTYLVGPPGVGKSTVMRLLTGRWAGVQRHGPPPWIAHVDASGEMAVAQLGRLRARFPGTDALSMSIGPIAAGWISTVPAPYVTGEGQRLGTRPFLAAAAEAGYRVNLISLWASSDVLDERCARRGTEQDKAWRTAARTRARNVTDWSRSQGFRVLSVDCSDVSPDDVADAVRSVSSWPTAA